MKVITIIISLLFAAVAFADSLVSDPKAEHIGINFQIWQAPKGLTDVQAVTAGAMIVDASTEADGSIKHNLDSLVVGSFNWYIRVCQRAYVYGPDNTLGGSSVCSVFIPFDFTKRSPVTDSIKGLKLVP